MLHCASCGYETTTNGGYCTKCGRPLAPSHTEATSNSVNTGRAVQWGGGVVATGIFLILLCIFPITVISIGLAKLSSSTEQAYTVWYSSNFMGMAILAVVWFLALRSRGIGVTSLGLTMPTAPPVKLVLMSAGVLGASLGLTALYSAIVNWLGASYLAPPEIPKDIIFPGAAAALTYQAVALWTPITEEIFFRGFVYAGLVPRLGAGLAILVSAVVFGGFHILPGLLIPTFMTGLLLAWLYHKTGSIWPPIAVHAGQNALALTLTWMGV